MTVSANGPNIVRFSPEQQGLEIHGGGSLTEFKSIAFPQEFAGAGSIGPLFYWSWVSASEDGALSLSPHQGFEIMTYSLAGEVGHSDSLGNRRRTLEGGAQLVQSGAGVDFQEKEISSQSGFLQIWFEPDFRKAMTLTPAFSDFLAEDFPVEESSSSIVKTLIGPGSPVQLKAEATLRDIRIGPGHSLCFDLRHGRVLAAVIVEGGGMWTGMIGVPVEISDFVVLRNEERFEVRAGGNGIRFVIAEVPREVNYPLYSGR